MRHMCRICEAYFALGGNGPSLDPNSHLSGLRRNRRHPHRHRMHSLSIFDFRRPVPFTQPPSMSATENRAPPLRRFRIG